MGKSINVRATHSHIQLNALNPKLENIDVETTHDDIAIVLDASLQAHVKYDTSYGDIDTDFKLDESRGPANIRLKTTHGDIKLRKLNQ